jgi:DNA-binding GntR family transcriptional regulator
MSGIRDVAAQPLYDVIYEVLRDHLREGRFPSGLVLGEAGVARAFATSRIPAAAALKRLHEEGWVAAFEGRGYLAGAQGASPPLRKPLAEAGLRLPKGLMARLAVRTTPARIYPDVEHKVATCLAYGRFLLNESALAGHYEVSRAVAHDVLKRLERSGIVSQDSNQRWYAGPLTPELVREHFQMRWLLEPAALADAASRIPRDELVSKQDRVAHLKDGHKRPRLLERIEEELHIELIERCRNDQLKLAVRRSQLPLFATHSTYRRFQQAEEIVRMAGEHWAVFEHLLHGEPARAAKALEAHLKRSMDHNVEVLKLLPRLPDTPMPDYLVPIKLSRDY